MEKSQLSKQEWTGIIKILKSCQHSKHFREVLIHCTKFQYSCILTSNPINVQHQHYRPLTDCEDEDKHFVKPGSSPLGVECIQKNYTRHSFYSKWTCHLIRITDFTMHKRFKHNNRYTSTTVLMALVQTFTCCQYSPNVLNMNCHQHWKLSQHYYVVSKCHLFNTLFEYMQQCQFLYQLV